MKQVSSDRYSIAWFKLAECISRGEKERALGVYRLLSHSFNDYAVAQQLEGDIHLAFNNQEEAIVHYYRAAEQYRKDNRILEAIAVYEHLLTLRPRDCQYRTDIINLYKQLGIASKVRDHYGVLGDSFALSKKWDKAAEAAATLETMDDHEVAASIYQAITFALINIDTTPQEHVTQYLYKAVDCLLKSDDAALQQFFSLLRPLDEAWYQIAFAYIKKDEKDEEDKKTKVDK